VFYYAEFNHRRRNNRSPYITFQLPTGAANAHHNIMISTSGIILYLLLAVVASLATSARAAFVGHHDRHQVFAPQHYHQRQQSSKLFGGFGGVSSKDKKGKKVKSATTTKKMTPQNAKKAKQQLLERYGGDLGKGTQERIDKYLNSLEPHIKEAAELYKSVTQFDALIAPMTASDRNRLIPPIQFEMVASDRAKLQSLMEEHKLTEIDLHNVFQQATWDASADAKATQADIVGGQMKPELQERINKACAYVVDATKTEGAVGKILDVGCGHGSIVKSLVDAGLEEPDMYVGIDLSPEMVKNAVERYGSARNGRTGKGRVFVADDFLAHDFSVYGNEDSNGIFDGVIFCSALHDLPDMIGSITKAASLLRSPGGKLVVVHAQGAQHVLGQHQANPVMVARGLPTAKEWSEMLEKHTEWGLSFEHKPADPRSDGDLKDGYLAVLSKI
jgi:SAM-dependent methyltransferase